MSQSLTDFLRVARDRVDSHLSEFLKDDLTFDEAMRYCVFNGGKRVRPALVYATADALGIDRHRVDGMAVAIELIHAYSLVHDDLPAMDDDSLRRGKPTCHVAYGEATAVLVGDALQCSAFEALATLCEPEFIAPLTKALARASGSRGMILGQTLDIEAEGSLLTEHQLEQMHRLKTGALIDVSVAMPTFLANVTQEETSALTKYSRALGLAFQIQDDILDVIADTDTLGKPSGSDESKAKPTYTSILGVEGAKEKLNSVHSEAIKALNTMSQDTTMLESLANYIVDRIN